MDWRDFQVDIPKGESGDWRVERFRVTEDNAKLHNLQCAFSGMGHRTIRPGTYTKLTRGTGFLSTLVMSDTPAEIRDILAPIRYAKGQVLVNGLGLGIVVGAMLEKSEVEHVTVIEISEDVINLVGSHLSAKYGDRLTIIHADALEWQPPKGAHYDVVWHDIWDNICGDNWESMKKLHRKYGRRCDWQGSWCREEVKWANGS